MEQWLHELHFDDTGAFVPHVHNEQKTADVDATAGASRTPTSARANNHTVASPQSEQQQQLDTSSVSTPWTPTPVTPQDLRTTTAADATHVVSFETLLSVPPARVFQSARSRTDAALLYDVSCVAIEMDAVIESVHEQLHDYERIGEWLHRAEQQNAHRTSTSNQADVMATALLALQRTYSSVATPLCE